METRSRKRAEASGRRPPPSQSSSRASKRARVSSSTANTGVAINTRSKSSSSSSAAAAAAAAAAGSSSSAAAPSAAASNAGNASSGSGSGGSGSGSGSGSMDLLESGSRKESGSGRRDKDKASKREHEKEDDRGSEKVLRGAGGDKDDKGKEKEPSRERPVVTGVGASVEPEDDNEGDGVSTLQQNLASASSALHGLLRKLGAGLDEFLPSSTPSAHQNNRLKRILSGLRAEGDEARQIEALSQLCELLSIGTEDSLSSFSVESFAPVLVGLLNHEDNPDVMLLAARALTNLCDVLPSSCAAVVHYGAVPCFCARLLTIEYIDLAEQSLQALEKISHEHPAACLRAGALIAVLSYLDFFSTGVQRVAVSTAANICRQLPADAVDFVMESVPILTNLLQYQDSKVVQHASLCLTRIADSFANSAERIDMLCSHGLIPLASRLVSVSSANGIMVSQTSLSASTYTGLIRLLSSCASGSAAAAESLLLLNISSILKDILTGAGLTSNPSLAAPSVSRLPEQLFEIVNLVNELLPPVPGVTTVPLPNEISRPSSSASLDSAPRIQLLKDRPEVLLQFGVDLFPVLVQVYGSSVTSSVRHKCLGALHRIIYFSTPEMLDALSKDTNISSFLAGVLASKDPSTLVTALHIAELLMQKLSALFSKLFVKEGVVHAIDSLIASDSGSQHKDVVAPPKPRRASSSRRRSGGNTNDVVSEDPGCSGSSPPSSDSPLQAVRVGLFTTAVTKAKHLKEAHFYAGVTDGAATESLCRLKSLCSKLSVNSATEVKGKGKGKAKATSAAPVVSEEQQLALLSEMFAELEKGDGVSTFEFVNSGVVEALLNFLSGGVAKEHPLRQQTLKRLKQFLSLSLPSSNRDPPMTLLVRKLQNALGSLERFPVILSHGPRATGSTASIAAGLSALTQPFKLRLCRAASEKVLRDYSTNIVLIEPLATLAAIEDFLWARVKRHDAVAASSESPATPAAPAVSISSPSTRSKTAAASAAAKDVDSASPAASKGKGKAKSADPRTTTENRGPETRNAAKRRAAAAAASAAAAKQSRGASAESEDDDAEGSPVDVEDAVAMEEDDVSEDEEDEVFGEEPAEVCIGDRVHDVQLGDPSADNAAISASATTSGTPATFGSGVGINIGGRSTVLISGTEASGSRTGTGAGKGSLSFAAAAMAGASASTKSRDRRSVVAASSVPPKLSFSLGGKQLNRSLTIFQAIQRQTALDEDDDERYAAADHPLGNGRRLWDEVYTITYQRADASSNVSPSKPDSGHVGSSSQVVESSWPQSYLVEGILQGELPCDLDKSSSTYNILLLLRVLEGLNRLAPRLRAQGVADAFAEGKVSIFSQAVAGGAAVQQEEFLSSKLTPKLARQMQDALALCSGGLPAWCHQLTKACPFLFPFETRRQYFHSTAFGLSRALQRLQQQQSADGSSPANERELRVGRPQRQKVRVSRTRILDSAAKVMELYSGHKAVLEVEYFGEVGTGLGPTLEFYTLVSRELQKITLDLWRTDGGQSRPASEADTEMPDVNEDSEELTTRLEVSSSEYVTALHGLFPRPWQPTSTDRRYVKAMDYFRLLGRVMAKALQDGRLLDFPFSVPFYKLVLGQELDLYDVKAIDPELGSTLDELQALVRRKQFLESNRGRFSTDDSSLRFRGSRVEDLCLDFTLPGYPEFHLRESGPDITVTLDNLEEYVALVVDATVKKGISAQLEALRSGFSQVFQLNSLQIFTEQELDYLLCGRRELWTPEMLADHIKFDHGYTSASPPVRHLLEIMGEFSAEEQRDFLRFVTGAPRLPPGGLASLSPKLTIVRKHPTGNNGAAAVMGSTPPGAACALGTTLADGDLPSVMTCANYLKLPPYSTREVMLERLRYAISEGQGSFDLS